MKYGGKNMSLKHNLTQSKWESLSEQTRLDIEYALGQELDNIGIFVENKSEKSVSELVQMGQSMSNPTSIGTIQSKEQWELTARNGNKFNNLKPYSENGFSSLIVNQFQVNPSVLSIPLKRNLTEQNCSFPKNASRFPKFVDSISHVFGIKVVENAAQISSYEIGKVKESAFKKSDAIILNCNKLTTSDYDRFAAIFNCIAKIGVGEKLKTFDDPSYLALNDEDKNNFKFTAEKLVTLGLARATILSDELDQKQVIKLDDALKFEFFKTLALLSGKRNNVAKSISNLAEQSIVFVCEKLGYEKNSISKYLKSLNFTYKEEPSSLFDAIYKAGNFEAIATRVENAKDEETTVSKAETQSSVKAAVKASFALTMLLQRNILAYEGKLKASIANKKSYEEFFESESSNIIEFVLNKKVEKATAEGRSTKNLKTAANKSNEISQEFAIRVNAMLKNTFEFAKEKAANGNLETRSVPKLFRMANNQEGENKSPTSIAKATFNEVVKDVVKRTKQQEKAAKKAKKQPDEFAY